MNARLFPNPTKDQQVAFSYHSTRIERIPVSKADLDQTLTGSPPSNKNSETNESAHFQGLQTFHCISGQLKCLNLIKTFAADPDFIPHPDKIKEYNIYEHLEWMKRLHKNLMSGIANFGYDINDPNIIHPSQVGRWREERKWVSDKEMPNPYSIKKHLYNWLLNLAQFHEQYRKKIEMPQLLTQEDLEILANKAYETNLKICCIKPFYDGSNRIARLTENTIRLNWGLPFKIIQCEDKYKLPYTADIEDMQSSYKP